MLFTQLITPILLFSTTLTTALSIPLDTNALSLRLPHDPEIPHHLIKRKGGGGRGSGSGRSGGTGRTTSSSGGSGRTSTSTNTGGRSSAGSGVKPTYGGGTSYAGGARVPYSAGAISPLGIAPYLLVGAGLGFWTAHSWPYGAYTYQFPANVTFYNQTSGRNESVPVVCLCSRYQECGCDSNTDGSYVGSLLGNGSVKALAAESDVVQLDIFNGTKTLLVDGTLANGTTASGGAAGGRGAMLGVGGWGIVVGGMACALMVL